MTLNPIGICLAPGALLGRLSADIIRYTTLVSLVTEWRDEQARQDVIAALDNLAVIAEDATDETEILARVRAVECAADMDPADVAITLDDLVRIRDELDKTIADIRSTHLVLSGRLG